MGMDVVDILGVVDSHLQSQHHSWCVRLSDGAGRPILLGRCVPWQSVVWFHVHGSVLRPHQLDVHATKLVYPALSAPSKQVDMDKAPRELFTAAANRECIKLNCLARPYENPDWWFIFFSLLGVSVVVFAVTAAVRALGDVVNISDATDRECIRATVQVTAVISVLRFQASLSSLAVGLLGAHLPL